MPPKSSDRADAVQLIKDQCTAWLEEAAQLRALKTPGDGAAPVSVHAALVAARGRLDRLETLLSMAIALKSGAAIRARELAELAEDAWDEKAQTAQRRGIQREFEGAQERYALWRLATKDERKAARTARSVADIAEDTELRIRRAYYGLDGVRQDMLHRLKYLAWESTLER